MASQRPKGAIQRAHGATHMLKVAAFKPQVAVQRLLLLVATKKSYGAILKYKGHTKRSQVSTK